jgi:hypothetical protein
VVFVPDVPDTTKGRVLLAGRDRVHVLSSTTANQVDGSLKRLGRGLLSQVDEVITRARIPLREPL